VGGVGHPGEVSVLSAVVGSADPGGLVPIQGLEQETPMPAQDAIGTHAAVAGCADSLVSPADLEPIRWPALPIGIVRI
jgi:hypothetical protein